MLIFKNKIRFLQYMRFGYFMKGVYYSVRSVADELDNMWALSRESLSMSDYQQYNKDAKSFREKAKQNFRLAFQKDITDKLIVDKP